MNNKYFQISKIIAILGFFSFIGGNLVHAETITPVIVNITNTCDSSETVRCYSARVGFKKSPCGDHNGLASGFYFETPNSIAGKTGIGQLTLGSDSICYKYRCTIETVGDDTNAEIEVGSNYNCTLTPNNKGIHTCDISCAPEQ